jgi:MoCo/4Fe-4S cofactor protein with predicted Tat translocation signal
MRTENGRLDLSTLRLKLQAAQGKRYWRSLEEVAATPEFEEMIHREFPEHASEWNEAFSRRNFLKLMAASLALAGLEGCTKEPQERIVPYVRPPANLIPGRPLYFASAMPWRGVGQGVVVTSREGRPIKVEGNPDHPASRGAANIYMQASLLSLYDPDRSQNVVSRGNPSSWSAYLTALMPIMEAKRSNGGAGLRILTQTITSPSQLAELAELTKSLPEAKWHRYEPLSRDSFREGARQIFGKPLDGVLHFEKADVVVSLDSDFLTGDAGSLRYARDFMDRRRIRTLGESGRPLDVKTLSMNRLYVAECMHTTTGAVADHRLPLKPSDIGLLAAALARGVGAGVEVAATRELPAATSQWAAKVAGDLAANKGKSLVIAGDSQPPEVHSLVLAINVALGSIGQTLSMIEPLDPHPETSIASIRSLVDDMNGGKVDTLIIVGGNPVHTAPADLNFLAALQKVDLRIHLGEYHDETAFQCQWHIPEAHYLESWGDVRAYDGTASIVQPMIAPLYQGKSVSDLLAVLAGKVGIGGYEVLRNFWSRSKPAAEFEAWWKTALEKGVIAGSASPAQKVEGKSSLQLTLPAASTEMELLFKADPTIDDGRFANNGWLQELPKPLTHMTWDNAAMVSAHTAHKLGVQNGDLVELKTAARSLLAAIWILPGHADDAVTLSVGYGRTRAGRVGGTDKEQIGFDAYRLRTSTHPLFATDLQIAKTDKTYNLVVTHTHHTVESDSVDPALVPQVVAHPEADESRIDIKNRKLIRVATLAEFKADPQFAQKIEEAGSGEEVAELPGESHKRVPLQLFPEHDYSNKINPNKHRWAMSIDTHSCIGCSACVIACQAENNIPVVGKDQVERGREMHWIRIDTYHAGLFDNPETYFQPLPCMHCENAPCELVCPVAATVHDDEGINNMVYNRCVGTRYCANNCPYKVRRFNFLQYQDETTDQYKLLRNPEVTVRSRGVMEKCSYCIQRINNTRIDAETMQVRLEEQFRQSTTDSDRADLLNTRDANTRKLFNGLQTACQQSCPTEAIVFGDLNDSLSAVALLKAEPHDYGLLDELTTRPRTTYLARVRNPNPEMSQPTA